MKENHCKKPQALIIGRNLYNVSLSEKLIFIRVNEAQSTQCSTMVALHFFKQILTFALANHLVKTQSLFPIGGLRTVV
jgi:hypothetical protein